MIDVATRRRRRVSDKRFRAMLVALCEVKAALGPVKRADVLLLDGEERAQLIRPALALLAELHAIVAAADPRTVTTNANRA